MPIWGYFVIGGVILLLVLLTARRNVSVVHNAPEGYRDDFSRVLDDIEPAIAELRDAVRSGEERPVAMAASRARSKVRNAIAEMDRLNVSDRLAADQRDLVESLRVALRQAMENYEWAARIAETTDLIDNVGLRRGFDSLVAAGDQLCVETRFDLAGLVAGA